MNTETRSGAAGGRSPLVSCWRRWRWWPRASGMCPTTTGRTGSPWRCWPGTAASRCRTVDRPLPVLPTDTGLIFPGPRWRDRLSAPAGPAAADRPHLRRGDAFHLAIFDADAAEDVMEQFRTSSTGTSASHSWAGPWPPNSRRTTLTDRRPYPAGGYLYGDLTRRRTPSPSTAPEPERGGRDRLHRERGGDPGRQPCPVRQLRPPEGGRACDYLGGGTAGPDGGGRGGVYRPAAGINERAVGRFGGFAVGKG